MDPTKFKRFAYFSIDYLSSFNKFQTMLYHSLVERCALIIEKTYDLINFKTARAIHVSYLGKQDEIETMKKLILLFILTQALPASTHKYIYTVQQLKDHLEYLITRQKRNPRDLKYLHNNIKLVHGFYYIKQDDHFFTDLLKSLNRENRFFVLKAQFIIHYQYNEKEDIEVKHNMGVTETLNFFDQKLKAGLKFSRESRYLIYKEEDLLRFLPRIASNRSDSVLIMKYCRKSPCVRNRKILAKIPTLMTKNDGMSLRISSKFHSLEKNKLKYFKDRLQPFTPNE